MGLREGRDMFEVTQQCMVDWAWHLVSNTNAVLNAGLCFSRDKCPLPFACWVLQRGGGGCSSGQFLEPSHSPTLLSPSESRSTTHMWAACGQCWGPPQPLDLFLIGHSLGNFPKKNLLSWLRLCIFSARGGGSIPGKGTKIPRAMWYDQ